MKVALPLRAFLRISEVAMYFRSIEAVRHEVFLAPLLRALEFWFEVPAHSPAAKNPPFVFIAAFRNARTAADAGTRPTPRA